MFRMVGGSLGVAVTGAIFQGSVGSTNFAAATPQEFVDALSSAMTVSAAVALAGAVVAVVAIRPRAGAQRRGGRGRGQPGGSAVAAAEATPDLATASH